MVSVYASLKGEKRGKEEEEEEEESEGREREAFYSSL